MLFLLAESTEGQGVNVLPIGLVLLILIVGAVIWWRRRRRQ
jgi:uncharacterized iron-regulated membrane protein